MKRVNTTYAESSDIYYVFLCLISGSRSTLCNVSDFTHFNTTNVFTLTHYIGLSLNNLAFTVLLYFAEHELRDADHTP